MSAIIRFADWERLVQYMCKGGETKSLCVVKRIFVPDRALSVTDEMLEKLCRHHNIN
jgi:hypothetical protein